MRSCLISRSPALQSHIIKQKNRNSGPLFLLFLFFLQIKIKEPIGRISFFEILLIVDENKQECQSCWPEKMSWAVVELSTEMETNDVCVSFSLFLSIYSLLHHLRQGKIKRARHNELWPPFISLQVSTLFFLPDCPSLLVEINWSRNPHLTIRFTSEPKAHREKNSRRGREKEKSVFYLFSISRHWWGDDDGHGAFFSGRVHGPPIWLSIQHNKEIEIKETRAHELNRRGLWKLLGQRQTIYYKSIFAFCTFLFIICFFFAPLYCCCCCCFYSNVCTGLRTRSSLEVESLSVVVYSRALLL